MVEYEGLVLVTLARIENDQLNYEALVRVATLI